MLSRLTVCHALTNRSAGSLLARRLGIRYNTRDTTAPITNEDDNNGPVTKTNNDKPLYEGPLAGITTRLKIVSITTASGSILGIPYLILTHTGELALMGQFAVGAAALLAGTGSTFVLNFFFSPYVHALERIPVRKCEARTNENPELKAAQEYLVKATTRNMFCQKIETVFDPANEVSPYKGARPFANFVVKGAPFFVHGELIHDHELRNQLLPGMKDEDGADELSKNSKEDFDRDDDDEISPLGR